ncbi:MAG TPA: YkgJ family cysteine cluster protein [Bryobacteraceae bacterium]|nr:YkgJ family cysteine cluster protein [Bryobacteraceae bacterium]
MHGGLTLVQIVDAAMAESVRKSGSFLACRPGCCECCMGPFPITQDDAERLRQGLTDLETRDPKWAGRIRTRARNWAGSDDESCPALDPDTGTCDLYTARPVTCRAFGPPVRCTSGALAICELCFVDATENEIGACVVDLDPAILGDIDETGAEITVASVLAE